MKYLLALVLAFTITYLIMPVLIKLSIDIGFVDKPNARKDHKVPTPLCGGISIFISFFIVYWIFAKSLNTRFWGIIGASMLILAIGIVDDWCKAKGKELQAMPKFIVQTLAAIIVYKCGIVFIGFTNPFTDSFMVLPSWLQFVFTVVWIFGVTTVINFVDGLDGLAGGIAAICASTLFIVALVKNQAESTFMAVILVGAALSFLQYNKPPAKAFLGDSGATLLGFILGVISIDGAFKQATVISIFIPVLALGVPIFDNIFVVIKRILEKKPIYKADKSQIHYRLVAKGLSQGYTTLFLYLISICFSLTSIILLLLSV